VWPERLFWSAYLLRHIVGQRGYAFRPRASILADQKRRIRRMIEHAYRRVPYYQETMDRLGLRPSDFQGADDLARLPLLERREIQSDPERFIARGTNLKKCLALHSSGSSGAPLTVFHDRRAALQTVAHSERYRSVIAGLVGHKRRYRETIIQSVDSSSLQHRRFWLGSTVLGKSFIPKKQILSVFDPPERNIRLLSEFAPDVVLSNGSSIGALFARLESWAGPVNLPKVAGYGADYLPDELRRLIQERFGVAIVSAYASVEVQRIGFECELHTGIHLNEDIYPLRITDSGGRTLDPGEEGEVVVSNLINRAMVILNYRLGDAARFLPGSCPCGRSLPLLSFPRGRPNDWIRLAGGRTVHAYAALDLVLRDESAVFQFQFVQDRPGFAVLSLVLREGSDWPSIESRLARRFRQAFGDSLGVEFRRVDSIPRQASGKVRVVVSSAP
jgi:phenylacetate-CoA ligase